MAEAAEPLNAELVKAMQMPCAVRVGYDCINAENGQPSFACGIGMIINERHILTCKHVVEHALDNKCIVLIHNGPCLEGTVTQLKYSTGVDLALIELPENYERSLTAPLSFANFIEETDLCECYVYKKDASCISKGRIYDNKLDSENNNLWLVLNNRDVDCGSSGSPIMDAHGRVRGILVHVDYRATEFLEQSKGTDLPATCYGLPSNIIIRALRRNGIGIGMISSSEPFGSGFIATDATVTIAFTLPREKWKKEYKDHGSAEYVSISNHFRNIVFGYLNYGKILQQLNITVNSICSIKYSPHGSIFVEILLSCSYPQKLSNKEIAGVIKCEFLNECYKSFVISIERSSVYVFLYEYWCLSWRKTIKTNGKVVFDKCSPTTQERLLELLQMSECSRICAPNGELDDKFVEYISAKSPQDINTWIFAMRELELEDASECSIALVRLMEMAMKEAELTENYGQPTHYSVDVCAEDHKIFHVEESQGPNLFSFPGQYYAQPVEWNPVCEKEEVVMKAHMAARVTHPTDDLTQPYEDFKRVPLGNEDEQSLTKQDDKTEKRSSRVESCPQEASEKGFRHENINVAADSKESKIRRLQ